MTYGKELSRDELGMKEKVLDLEILYLVNLKPRRLRELTLLLLNIFELDLKEASISSRLDCLISSDLVTKTTEEIASNEEVLFSVTTRGTKALDDGIQKLSEIALTMQLALTQPLVKS